MVALSKWQERPAPRSVRGLVPAPTRELAGQIVQCLQELTAVLRITLVVGGRSIDAQAEKLDSGTDILVGTPGRLIDLMDRRAIDLSQTRFLVLDEADPMLDIGFIHALDRISPMLSRDRQTMMFSATMPKAMAELSCDYLDSPIRIEVSPPRKVADKVAHSVHFVAKEQKQDQLIELLDGHRNDRALVFSRTKHGAERLTKQLDRTGFAATSIHGNKSQGQRDRAIAVFRDGSVRILVATDVAARGIDIPGVGRVYNFDLPNVPEIYLHQIGRTAEYGEEWTWERGLFEIDGRCDPVALPANAFLDPASYGHGWRCERGFEGVDNTCTPIDLPANAHLDRLRKPLELRSRFATRDRECVIGR